MPLKIDWKSLYAAPKSNRVFTGYKSGNRDSNIIEDSAYIGSAYRRIPRHPYHWRQISKKTFTSKNNKILVVRWPITSADIEIRKEPDCNPIEFKGTGVPAVSRVLCVCIWNILERWSWSVDKVLLNKKWTSKNHRIDAYNIPYLMFLLYKTKTYTPI